MSAVLEQEAVTEVEAPVEIEAPVETPVEVTPDPKVKATPRKKAPSKPKSTTKKATAKVEAKPKVQEPKTYVFGGSLEKPELGANSRRLWTWVLGNVTVAQRKQLRKDVLAYGQALPTPDRFVRWQHIVAVATEAGITGKDGTEINTALVRRLQGEDKDGKIGRDTSITIA